MTAVRKRGAKDSINGVLDRMLKATMADPPPDRRLQLIEAKRPGRPSRPLRSRKRPPLSPGRAVALQKREENADHRGLRRHARRSRPARKKEGYRGVEVIYSKQGETADEVMMETIRKRQAGLLVVTFDRAIIDEAKKHAVPFITPARLEAAMAGGGPDDEDKGRTGEKGQPPQGAEGDKEGKAGDEKNIRGAAGVFSRHPSKIPPAAKRNLCITPCYLRISSRGVEIRIRNSRITAAATRSKSLPFHFCFLTSKCPHPAPVIHNIARLLYLPWNIPCSVCPYAS